MIVKPRIRGFICTTAHPDGCAAHVREQIDYVKGRGAIDAGVKNVLVIGAEKMSSIVDWNDRGTCILFADGAGAVVLSAEETDDHITVHVRDNGIGIPPDKLPTIAEPFAQVRNDPHLTRDGKGLGLAIVKSLIDAHNGKLTIDSIPGDGTTMTVHFPKGKT